MNPKYTRKRGVRPGLVRWPAQLQAKIAPARRRDLDGKRAESDVSGPRPRGSGALMPLVGDRIQADRPGTHRSCSALSPRPCRQGAARRRTRRRPHAAGESFPSATRGVDVAGPPGSS